MQAGRHQTGDMGHIHHEQGINFIGDPSEPGKIDDPRIGAGPGHNHFRFFGKGDALNLFHINPAGFFFYAIGDEVIKLTGKIDAAAVGQMAAMGQIHAQHLVAGLQTGEIDRHIGLTAGMGLHIGVFGTKEFHGPGNGQRFNFVRIFAAAVIAFAGVAFRIFVGKNGALGFKHGGADDVFRGDELKLIGLALEFIADGSVNGRVCLF